MPFDSRQYEFADLSLILGGRDTIGLRGLKYSEKIEREPLYAKGRYPHHIQSGNISYEGEITMLQEDYEILTAAGNGSVLNLKGMNAIANYGNISNGDSPITDSLENIYFTSSEKEMKQGDKNMEVKLPFICTRILRQVA